MAMTRALACTFLLSIAGCSDPQPAPDETVEVVPEAGMAADSITEPSIGEEPVGGSPTDAEPVSDRTPYEELRGWVGHSAVREDGSQFILQPSVRPQIEEALSVEPGLMDQLTTTDGEPAYLPALVDFAGGAFALTFPVNPTVEARPLWMLIHAETGHTFAILTDGGDTFYRASYDADIDDLSPEAIAWMEAQSGVPFEQLARESAVAPISP